MKDVKISNLQLGLLSAGFLYGSTAIANPALAAKRDSWIALIFGWIGGFILITMYLFISKLNPRETLTEILVDCFGKFVGKGICILYIWYFLHLAAMNLRGFGEFMATVSYPETPLIVLMAVNMLAVAYVARSGLETLGRISEVLVPILPIPVLVVSASIMTFPSFTGFEPVLLDISLIIKSTFSVTTSPFGDFVAFLMILPYTNSRKGRFKATYLALIAIGILLMIITARNIIVLGPVLTEFFMYPSHISAQLIPSISIDPLVDINLLLGGGIKIAVYIYAATKATAEIFKFDNYQPLVAASSTFVIVLAMWIFQNALEWKNWLGSTYGIVYAFPFQILIPALMLIISLIKKRKKISAISRNRKK